MSSQKKYIRYTWFVVIMVFLVILAGGVVRMTQSGMGCPDWPRCFGRWVPPVNANQLPPDFEKYLRAQDIDHSFNPYHTWIEYINRLLGALLGVFIFIHFIWSLLKYRKTDRTTVAWSFFLLLAVGFQGWLGKKVVDHNLAAVKVTTHMIVALLIAAIPLVIIYRHTARKGTGDRLLKNAAVAVLGLLLIQIALGTQVREQVDEISRSLGWEHRERWISRLDNMFPVHRSFSWVVFAGCVFLFFRTRKFPSLRFSSGLILTLVFASMLLGIILAYTGMPAIAQPLHLLAGSLLAMALFSFRLQLK